MKGILNMIKIKRLNISKKKIKVVKNGIENMINLEILNILKNKIEEINN
jgi:Leucine-rich repeat (LRR) protein